MCHYDNICLVHHPTLGPVYLMMLIRCGDIGAQVRMCHNVLGRHCFIIVITSVCANHLDHNLSAGL